jgi:hypothetical protein
LIATAAGQDRRRVHSSINGDFVPADELQIGMIVCFCIGNAAFLQEPHKPSIAFNSNPVCLVWSGTASI